MESIPKRFVRNVSRRIAASLALAALLGGCSKVGTTSVAANGNRGNAWTHHGRLVYAEAQNAKSLDPITSTDSATGDLSMLLFSYAVRYDEKAVPHPDALSEIPTLANGDVSKDGLTLKYKLRPNIYFHDGVQLTCRDLAFTWHVVLNPANNDVTQDGFRDIKSVDCSNPLVAVVHMKRVYAPFLQQLWGVNGNAPILPEHILAKYNDAQGSFNHSPFESAPVGSGAFQFVRWDRGSQVVLKAFPRYFMGRPKLDEVVYKYVPDQNTLAQQIRSHEVDMALHIGASVYPQLQNIPGTTLLTPPIFSYDHLDFNLRSKLFANDVNLRRALQMGLDRADLLRKVSHGLGDLTDTALSPKISPAWTSDTAHYDFDLERARALLASDGWKAGPDGVRVRSGQRLAFNLATQNESSTGKANETVIQSEWRALGADVAIKNGPTEQFFDNTKNGILQGGHYDTAIFAWSAAADPDDSAIYSGKNMAPAGQNAIFWNNPIANASMVDELSTVDPARRRKDFKIEQQQFASDVPSIILGYRREPAIFNSDLRGFTMGPVISPFWNPYDYSI